MPEELYYIQSRGCVGNCLLWWAEGGHGYVCDLSKAWRVPKSQAESICSDRPTQDIPWPVALVDAVSERHVNCQSLEGKL